MSLIIYGCAAPVLIALIAWIRTDARRSTDTRRSIAEAIATPPLIVAGRWDGLTEEIARRGNRRHARRDDASLRRRHLAAVLPADARR